MILSLGYPPDIGKTQKTQSPRIMQYRKGVKVVYVMATLQLKPEIFTERLATVAQTVPNISKMKTTSLCVFFFIFQFIPDLSIKIISSVFEWVCCVRKEILLSDVSNQTL